MPPLTRQTADECFQVAALAAMFGERRAFARATAAAEMRTRRLLSGQFDAFGFIFNKYAPSRGQAPLARLRVDTRFSLSLAQRRL